MATYSEMVTKVRDWANRDIEVLSDANINDFLEYAADDCYRILRIPPLEHVHRYELSGSGDLLTIPEDCSEFIELRRTSTANLSGYEVYQAKNDIRSFQDDYTRKTDYFRWTRQQNCIIVNPQYNAGDVFELFYYRRLSDLNATYIVNVDNYNAGYLTETMDTTAASLHLVTDADGNITAYATAADVPAGDTAVETYFVGQEADNWLRDRHERTLLFGALKYAFTYLSEDDMVQKYDILFMGELDKLNKEENMRKALGGNVQTLFNTGGLI